MKQIKCRRWLSLIVAVMFGLVTGLAVTHSIPIQAASVPQSIDVKKEAASDIGYSYSRGYRTTIASGYGIHFVDTIKDTDNNLLFCVQWSKAAPSNTRIAAKMQAQPAVTWLVNNYAKGAGKRFTTLGKGDEGDYWLYQAVIHWITEPNDVDGADGYNIQHYFGTPGLATSVENKIKALHTEALKQAKAGTTEEVLNTHAMSFDPTALKLDGSNLSGDMYSKSFTFKSTNMRNVKVWLDGQPSGTKLSGSGVDLNNVDNGAKINLQMPYKDVTTSSKTFHVKAKGDWNKEIRVAYIYGDAKNTNQNVAKQIVKATTVPLDVTANMDVSVTPATGKITFLKKGSANNNSQLLPGTKFKLTGGSVVQEATADANGKVEFKSLPLGIVYDIVEIEQPNKYYTTSDLAKYHTTVSALSGSHPSTSATAFGGTLVNVPTHTRIVLEKVNADSKAVANAQFVVLQVKKDAGVRSEVKSLADVKAKAMHQEGDYIVAGDNKGKPAIVTSDKEGSASFGLVATDPQKYDYYVVEINAPKKYQLTLDIKKLDVKTTGPNTLNFQIKDDLKTPIPATGSYEILFYEVAIGTSLMLMVVVLYVAKPFRKHSK